MSDEKSPIAQVDPNSLSHLFSMDPEKYTDENIETIVAYYRKNRETWNAQDKAKKEKASTKKVAAQADLKLDDLDIQI